MGSVCARRSPTLRAELVPAHHWMEWFLGVTERELLASDRGRLLIDGAFVDQRSGRRWQAGKFECLSVGALEQRVSKIPVGDDGKSAGVELTVMDGVDIGRLQATLRTEDCAMVQVASNFNCLEVPSRRCPPDSGSLVERYAVDSTQGPAASFGVPAASLLRAHYAFRDEGTPSGMWGQTLERQVELLDGVHRFFGACVNGKLTLDGSEEEIHPEQLDCVAQDIQVGLHSDAQVVFGRGPGGALEVVAGPPDREPQLVDQLLSASVCLPDPGCCRSEAQLEQLMRAALRACYQGTYLAAILRRRRLLLLTLVGGGVFGNPEEAILEEIARAHARWAGHLASSLERVCVCLYPKGAAAETEAALRRKLAQWS